MAFNNVPQPHRAYDLMTQATSSLSALPDIAAKQDAEARMNAPVNPLQQAMIDTMLKYTQRIRNGEDPARVTDEAKQDPIVLQYRQSQNGGGLAAPAANQPPQAPQSAQQRPSYPDIGAPGGQPQMAMPGQFDPTRGPPPAAPSMPPGQSLGAPPQGPVSGALDMTPQQTPFARLSAAPVPTQSLGGRSQEFGSQPAPAMGQAPAPRPAPQAQAPYQYTQRDFQQMSPLMPTMMAQQGQMERANVNAQVKQEVEQSRSNTAQFIALLKQQGMDSDRASREAIEFSKLDVRQQQAVLSATTRLQVANIGADSRVQAAGIGAGSRERVAAGREEGKANKKGEDSAEKELRALINAQANITSKPEWTKDADAVATFKSHQKRIAELQSAVGRPAGATPPAGSSTSPGPTFSPQAPAPKPSQAPAKKALSQTDQDALDWANKMLADPKASPELKAKAKRIKAKALGR